TVPELVARRGRVGLNLDVGEVVGVRVLLPGRGEVEAVRGLKRGVAAGLRRVERRGTEARFGESRRDSRARGADARSGQRAPVAVVSDPEALLVERRGDLPEQLFQDGCRTRIAFGRTCWRGWV